MPKVSPSTKERKCNGKTQGTLGIRSVPLVCVFGRLHGGIFRLVEDDEGVCAQAIPLLSISFAHGFGNLSSLGVEKANLSSDVEIRHADCPLPKQGSRMSNARC